MLCLWCILDTYLAYEKQRLYAAWFAGPCRLRLPEHQPASCLGQFACLLCQSSGRHQALVAAALTQYDELSPAIIPDAPGWTALCLTLTAAIVAKRLRTLSQPRQCLKYRPPISNLSWRDDAGTHPVSYGAARCLQIPKGFWPTAHGWRASAYVGSSILQSL